MDQDGVENESAVADLADGAGPARVPTTAGGLRGRWTWALPLLLAAAVALTAQPAAAGRTTHGPLHGYVLEADLVALVVRDAPADCAELPLFGKRAAAASHCFEAQTVPFRVVRVLTTTREVEAGARIPVRTPPVLQGFALSHELTGTDGALAEATWLALLTWDEALGAYEPAPFTPRVMESLGPAQRHPATRGHTWLTVRGWDQHAFCPPELLPITYADEQAIPGCATERHDLDMWFTLEDFLAVDWRALSGASYPVEHVEACMPPYVLPEVPLATLKVRVTPETRIRFPERLLRRCWQKHLQRHPGALAAVHEERLVVVGGETFFEPARPVREIDPEVTQCIRRRLLREPLVWRQPPGVIELRLELEFSQEPRWGVEANPHFKRFWERLGR